MTAAEEKKQTKRKSAKIELAKRIRVVQDWLLQDHTTTDIINQCITAWKVTDRQAYRYLWAANRFFIEKDILTLEVKRSYYLARKKKLLRDMNPEEKKTAPGVAAINRVLDSMAKLEGVTVETLKLIGDKDNPLITESKVQYSSGVIDYSLLPTDFLKALLASHKQVS